LFPLVYYITHLEERYRHPIDPVIVIFAVFGCDHFPQAVDEMAWEKRDV